jgi:hypothetical protein
MGTRGTASLVVGLLSAAFALFAVGSGASSADSSRAIVGSGTRLVQFVRPTGDTLVGKGTGPIRVIVQLRAGARLTKVDVDGVDVTRFLRRTPGDVYGGLLRFGLHLHYGYNDAFAQAAGRAGGRATAHVRFIVAQRDDRLLRLSSFRVQTSAAPLQVSVREAPSTHVGAILSVAQGVSARVYVNDRRVDRGFSLHARRLVVGLGAGEGLRFGRNLVQILVHKTHPYQGQSRYDIESRTVYIGRAAPIASAGADQTVMQGDSVQLDGDATKLPPGWATRSFRWKIVSAPAGSAARLRNASRGVASLVPDRPGVYDVRVSVRGARLRPPVGVGARYASASSATAAATGNSSDTTTLTVRPNIPPAGVRLDTTRANVLLDGQPVRGTEICTATEGRCHTKSKYINYVVLDRETLQPVASGSVAINLEGIQSLDTIIGGYTGSLRYLVVVSFQVDTNFDDATKNALDNLLQKIGAQPLTAYQRFALEAPGLSAVGVAGAPAGSAFVQVGRLAGSLRLNGVTGKDDFVFTDSVDFDTDAGQTGTDISPAELTIRLGNKTYTQRNPGGGVSGFHLVVVGPEYLPGPQSSSAGSLFTTNAADGAEQPAAVTQLASALQRAADNPARPLVFLQAFGAPHGNDAPWGKAAQEIERLGGTRQVFNAMNATDSHALDDESPNRRGPYAFVGRVGSTAPLAEASYSLNGLPGRLSGVLMRAHDGGYEPAIAGPPRSDGQSPVNTELIHIADQVTEPFPAFTDSSGKPIGAAAAQAVQKFLGSREVTGLCSPNASVCDIRETYYENYRAPWPSIEDDLTDAKDKCSQAHPGFSVAECQGIRAELRTEVSMVAKVQQYFGPLGLQQPFGASGVAALADLNQIAQGIKDAVQPPPNDNTTSSALLTISHLLTPKSQLGPNNPAAVVSAGLSAAFAIGAYFTSHDGSPDLIGPQVTTSASKLGVELQDRYLQAGNNLDDLGRLIVSDYGKLSAVADKVDATPGPGEFDWRLGNVGQAEAALRLAARQTIYERLVPLAYPVMYDLGQIGNARDWNCSQGYFDTSDTFPFVEYFPKYLFKQQSDNAQFVARFPETPWTPTIAVAEARATGNNGGARIRGIPDAIANLLFKSSANGGMGFSKLQFYSPGNGFRYFPRDPAPGTAVEYDTDAYQPNLHQTQGGEQINCANVPDPPGNAGP